MGECERIESDDGVMGFFDEGVVVEQGDPAKTLNRPKTGRLKQFLSRIHLL